MKTIDGGVTAAKGFEAAGVAAGIKYQNRKDMALIYSTVPAVAAGTFTRNVVKAAPVLWDMDVLANSGDVRAVVVNAGIANACTGHAGQEHCVRTAEAAAAALGIETNEVLLGSTGVIGMPLPIARIEAGVEALVREKSGERASAHAAATAIMTTDTRVKEVAVVTEIGDSTVTIGGMAKGSGMIHPNMSTLLAYVTTDAAISHEMLTKAVSEIVTETYNMVSVDGDTSTNDTLLVLANALADNPVIWEEGEDYHNFKTALHYVNRALAKMIAADGEGATTLIEVEISGAVDITSAQALAKSVVASSLVKAAVYGRDANWGRILCALGYAGVPFDPAAVSLAFTSENGHLVIYEYGQATDYDEEVAGEILQASTVTIAVKMGEGEAAATAWGCDLTEEYVKINADYRS
ncbi:MAG: bifunctional glutamate N-acetyltransferase/amino-acid acetyltransferase ArgJ [Lachnospiraceae bacterium]|jgi:glutamate N-acetyltransferase/amino-acid N-acetyltransferase|nr:bifunctional glutamate N-acetyltransferase/amino-acid acetyltransferase ArgJ [Lachnospiraceae bacterium]